HTADLGFEHADLIMIEAGSRLIEKKKLGARRQRARQLDTLADWKGQRPRRHGGKGLQVHELDELTGPLGDAVLLGRDTGQPERGGQKPTCALAVATNPDIVEHAEAIEERDVLEGSPEADTRDLVARRLEDRA